MSSSFTQALALGAAAVVTVGCVGCSGSTDAPVATAAAAAAPPPAGPSLAGAAASSPAPALAPAPAPPAAASGETDLSGAGDMRPDAPTQQALKAIDAKIDALELIEATDSLVALVAELKTQPGKVHGCIQAMDVLGQCYIMMRKLKPALQVYEDLIAIVEANSEISESRLYIAGYAIRGGLHEKLAGQGYAERRDADYAKATAGGAPDGYGRDIVDQFFNKHPLYKEKVRTGTVSEAWVEDRKKYKVGHTVGEASQLIVAKRFDEACELITSSIAKALEQGDGPASYSVLAFRHIRAQAYIGLCMLDDAIGDFTAVIDYTTSDDAYLADPVNQESVVQYVEALLDRGGLRHFLGLDGVREDWERAQKAMPVVDVSQHVSQLLGEWVQLESWSKLPKARKLVALNHASQAVEEGTLEEALKHYSAAIDEPDEASNSEQKMYDSSQLHQSRGAVLHMMGRDYSEDTAAAEALGVASAQATIRKLAMQMAQAFPACLEAATSEVRAAVKKEEGNAAVKDTSYVKAVKCYTEAIALDPTEHTIYSNRSMCYERLARWGESEADAREVIR